MRAAVMDGRCQPVRNFLAGARMNLNLATNAPVPGGAPDGAPSLAARCTVGQKGSGIYTTSSQLELGIDYALTIYVYSALARKCKLGIERSTVAETLLSIDTQAGSWVMFSRTGIRLASAAVSTVTVTWYPDTTAGEGDLLAIAAPTLTPAPWPVRWQPGSIIQPILA